MGNTRGTPPLPLLPNGAGAYGKGLATSANGAAHLYDGAYGGGLVGRGRGGEVAKEKGRLESRSSFYRTPIFFNRQSFYLFTDEGFFAIEEAGRRFF
jgi:hypothetical protein